MKNLFQLDKPLFFSLFFTLFFALGVTGQTVNIPDPVLLNKLLAHNPVIDFNADNQIQVSEAQAFTGNLNLAGNSTNPAVLISDATGIGAFVNISGLQISNNLLNSIDLSTIASLDSLKIWSNQLTTLDISQNPQLTKVEAWSNNLSSFVAVTNNNLKELDLRLNNNLTSLTPSLFLNLEKLSISTTGITSINLMSLSALEYLNISDMPLTTIDLSSNINLKVLYAVGTLLTQLDVSNNPILEEIGFWGNPQLTYINLKNGNNQNMLLGEGFLSLPNLNSACVDAIPISFPNPSWYESQIMQQNIILTTYCNFSPGQHNSITGNTKLDMGAGCADASAINLPNIMVETTDNTGTVVSATFTDNSGGYSLHVDQGTFTSSANLSLPAYFSSTPTSHNSSFSGYGNSDQADFCVGSTQSVNDLNVSLIPLNVARPGFNSNYKIVYQNMGTTTLTGQVVFQFDGTTQSFVSAIPAQTSSTNNSLTFGFTNLLPLQTEEISISLLNAQPPVLDLGDVLNLTATITPNTNDYTPNDNSSPLSQIVVNSADPNDKTVLEGDKVEIADADEYLHYVIRFQNMGTAPAINVLIADALNEKLDWGSFKMLSTSHDCRVQISDERYVEFIFEGINLPQEAIDEPGSHGYVAFKIKPKNNVAVGDFIKGKAAIYFDFNAPIITNTVSTEIVQNLSSENFVAENTIQVFPNPTSGILNISTQGELEKVLVYSITGKRLLLQKGNLTKIDFHQFPQGIYFLKILDKNGAETVKKIMKK